jgi:hypothetical protein
MNDQLSRCTPTPPPNQQTRKNKVLAHVRWRPSPSPCVTLGVDERRLQRAERHTTRFGIIVSHDRQSHDSGDSSRALKHRAQRRLADAIGTTGRLAIVTYPASGARCMNWPRWPPWAGVARRRRRRKLIGSVGGICGNKNTRSPLIHSLNNTLFTPTTQTISH